MATNQEKIIEILSPLFDKKGNLPSEISLSNGEKRKRPLLKPRLTLVSADSFEKIMVINEGNGSSYHAKCDLIEYIHPNKIEIRHSINFSIHPGQEMTLIAKNYSPTIGALVFPVLYDPTEDPFPVLTFFDILKYRLKSFFGVSLVKSSIPPNANQKAPAEWKQYNRVNGVFTLVTQENKTWRSTSGGNSIPVNLRRYYISSYRISETQLVQKIDFTSSTLNELTLRELNKGNLSVLCFAYMRSMDEASPDSTNLIIEFSDGSTFETGQKHNTVWEQFKAEAKIPCNAIWIKIILRAKRFSGTHVNGHFTDIRLSLKHRQMV